MGGSPSASFKGRPAGVDKFFASAMYVDLFEQLVDAIMRKIVSTLSPIWRRSTLDQRKGLQEIECIGDGQTAGSWISYSVSCSTGLLPAVSMACGRRRVKLEVDGLEGLSTPGASGMDDR